MCNLIIGEISWQQECVLHFICKFVLDLKHSSFCTAKDGFLSCHDEQKNEIPPRSKDKEIFLPGG